MRLAIRVFLDGKKVSEESLTADTLDVVRALAEKHADMLAGIAGMVEIEFLDEPDESQRYFRIGTDPRGMAIPIKIDL